jgi:flavin-dependent dehydrogenase
VTLVEEVRAISNYSYHIKKYIGKNYLCIGDAHRFVDPIFSFGLYFAVSEAQLASEAIVKYFQGETADKQRPFADFQVLAERGQDTIQSLLDCFWDYPFAFAFFAHSRYTDDVIDMFAGRIYEEEPSPGLIAIRNRVATGQQEDLAFSQS